MATQETEEFLIGLTLDFPASPELSSELWIMTQDDLAELAKDLADGTISETGSADPGELRKIEFVHQPEIWTTKEGMLCIDIEARTNLADPTEELEPPQVFLVRKDGGTQPLEGRLEGVVWSVAAQVEGDKAGASNFDCYDPRDQICNLTKGEYEPELDIVIQAEDFAQRMRVEASEKVLAALEEACERVESAP